MDEEIGQREPLPGAVPPCDRGIVGAGRTGRRRAFNSAATSANTAICEVGAPKPSGASRSIPENQSPGPVAVRADAERMRAR
ncbi:MAG: hypothetical protein ACR2OO_11355 [Thermomicrobiales bacterium]